MACNLASLLSQCGKAECLINWRLASSKFKLMIHSPSHQNCRTLSSQDISVDHAVGFHSMLSCSEIADNNDHQYFVPSAIHKLVIMSDT